MPEFDELREQQAAQRDKVERARVDALLAGDAVDRAKRHRDLVARLASDHDRADLRRAEREVTQLEADLGKAHDALSDERALRDRIAAALAEFTDPRRSITRLDDATPILLMPLRIETRFKSGERGQPQLWVRVYPDSCLVDSFEETLSEREVDNGRAFWTAIWRSGGDPDLDRAAWRELVAACGSGRAGWVVRRLVPDGPGAKPSREDEHDVLLVIVSKGPVPAEAIGYWKAAWRAGDDAASLQAAYDDLEGDVGSAEAQRIVATYRPANFDETPIAPFTRATAVVEVAPLQIAEAADLQVRANSWSSPARVDLLPERLVFVGYGAAGQPPLVVPGNPVPSSLIAGPDPSAPKADRLHPVDDQLVIPDDLAWMFDFERALEVGMGFRFDLTPEQAAGGFARVLVLGVRVSDTAAEGRQGLEQLLEHHLYSQSGLELLRQGTPTNNTEDVGSGYTWRDDSDRTFAAFYRQEPQFTPEADPLLRRDGQWLADGLGVSPDLVSRMPGASLTDRSEAHAMQIALWNATIGYLLGSQLTPVFSPRTVQDTRAFFTRHVTGRGPLPALRIGDQPYGIVPTVAFDQLDWFSGGEGFPARLYSVVRQVEQEWRPLLGRVSRIGQQGGDPHQVLLDVLGLHPSAAEYHPLLADSVEHKVHELSLLDPGFALAVLGLFPPNEALQLLRRLGYAGLKVPDLLEKVYHERQRPLTGPVVDDVPLSESSPIRAYAGGRNYIQWLRDAARTSLTAVQREDGFDDGKKPQSLLYLLLRHALQHSFREVALDLKVRAGTIKDLQSHLREPTMVHVATDRVSESAYAALLEPDEAVTGDKHMLLADHLIKILPTLEGPLPEHLDALDRLAGLPTARLERLFAEHVDTASHRLDAWKSALLDWGLGLMRAPRQNLPRVAVGAEDELPPTDGLYVGAYGWLEPLRPEGKQLEPVELPTDVDEAINRRDTAPLLTDSTNLGLVHAPSLSHAATAAVLRNGYAAHAGKLAVNLSSARVRAALEILEGLRNGQSMGALLGYAFERHLHDHGPLQVRALVYPLRRAFPLVANQIAKTSTTDGDAQESIAAMNVVDGRKLVEHVEKTGQAAYPFGVDSLPRRPGGAEEPAINAAVEHIRDVNEAVADLGLAESVFQAVSGNYERAAGTLTAFAKGNYPPEPEVVQTPRSGTTLTFRVGIHLPVAGPTNPLAPLAMTPLASVEPRVNAWLEARLPKPSDVGCTVEFIDRTSGTPTPVFISQAQLGLHPVDLLYRAQSGVGQALGDLDDRILAQLFRSGADVALDEPVTIRHTVRVPGKVTWFELEGLLRGLRQVVLGSRPLRPTDFLRDGEATTATATPGTVPDTRVTAARTALVTTHVPALDALVTTLDNPAITIDAAITAFVDAVEPLAAYRLPGTGTGFAYEWRAKAYDAVVAKVAVRVQTWEERLTRFDELLVQYDALPGTAPEAERVQRLRTAEMLVSTTVTDGLTPANHRLALDVKRAALDDVRTALMGKVAPKRATLHQLLADIESTMAWDAVDHDPLDLTTDRDAVATFRERMRTAVAQLREEVITRTDRVADILTAHAAATADRQADLVVEAARVIYGEDLVVVPAVSLATEAAAELGLACAHGASGLLDYVTTDPAGPQRDFPVDDWMHGVARVRTKLRHWESIVLLSDALPDADPPEIRPVQLPHQPGETWLALEIKPDPGPEPKLIPDRLLYAADFAEPFDSSQPIAGLLVDEWTEVVPGTHETTGVAFHYDRPNAEPPQAWLLALPAHVDGPWSWDDLLGAVNDALDTAKLRALEPVHLDGTGYAAFLPATHSAYTFPEISISNNLLRNLDIYAHIAEVNR